MIRKMLTGLACVLTASGFLALGIPSSQAYDKEAFGFAVTHFLNEGELPAVFKAQKGVGITVNEPGSKLFVCGSGLDSAVPVRLAKPIRVSTAFYDLGNTTLSLSISVSEYKSNRAAENAFSKLTKEIKTCDGETVGIWTDESGNVFPYETVVSSGKIPAVSVTGVASIFTNENSNNAAANNQPAYLNDNFNIYTLLNNVIISTEATSSNASNLTAKQKQALIKVANSMVTSWSN